MRMRLIIAIGVPLVGAGCAQAPPVATTQPATSPAVTTATGALSQAEVAAEVGNLRSALFEEVPQHTVPTAGPDRTWIALARAAVAASSLVIDRPQLLVEVVRNPRVQALCIVLAQPVGLPWEAIGGSQVSTGQAGRRGYFITPTGVFRHTPDMVDYRALGTFDGNHIRGLGLNGMRVWEFGWQSGEKGWLPDHEMGEMWLLLHATDPDYLEQRLGRPASEGCVRIPASMNRFLDLHGVLDAEYERAARDDDRLQAVLLPDRVPTPLAGDALVVVDSSPPG